MTLNINQFEQAAVLGQLDQQISRSGVVQGIVSAAQTTTPLTAGMAVNLDPANTIVGIPQFTKALLTDVSFGFMIYDPKAASVLTPNAVQVAMRWTGPTMWLLAGGTIAPGALVESTSADGTVVTFGTSSSKIRGLALDPGTTGALLRVILIGAPY